MSNARGGRVSFNFLAFLATVVGSLLLLLAQRPELRARPGEAQVGAAPVVATVGHGLTWTGTATLLVRASLAMRSQDKRAPAIELPAEEAAGRGDPPIV
ncbi:MAG: hypothetical protein R3B09_12705 [Nannocystaceae bacterium]